MTGIRGKPENLFKAEAKIKSEKNLESEKYRKVMMTEDYLCFSYDHVEDANKILKKGDFRLGDSGSPQLKDFGVQIKKSKVSQARCSGKGSPRRIWYFVQVWKKGCRQKWIPS